MRADYTFVFVLFAYTIKQSNMDAKIVKLIQVMVGFCIVSDLIYALVEVRTWFLYDDTQPIWQVIKPLHFFVIAIFVISFIIKVILLVFLLKANTLISHRSK
jgi:hypothetical protein